MNLTIRIDRAIGTIAAIAVGLALVMHYRYEAAQNEQVLHQNNAAVTERKSATVEFADNAVDAEDLAKKDENRPKPKVAKTITFMGLTGDQSRVEVGTILEDLEFRPLACKYNSERIALDCSYESAQYRFDLEFVHDRLASFHFHFPAKEHGVFYQTFERSFGAPTDYGRKGSKVFSWESERTVLCGDGEDKQCPAESLALTPSDSDQSEVVYMYTLLRNMHVLEQVQRSLAAHNR